MKGRIGRTSVACTLGQVQAHTWLGQDIWRELVVDPLGKSGFNIQHIEISEGEGLT